LRRSVAMSAPSFTCMAVMSALEMIIFRPASIHGPNRSTAPDQCIPAATPAARAWRMIRSTAASNRITTVAAGQRYLDLTLAQKLALAEVEHGGKSGVEQLSEREFEVFVRLAGGAGVQRIAEDLKLSASTVGTHLYNIKQKLGVSNQSELTLIAIRLGLIEA